MKKTYLCWALSRQFLQGRSLLGKYCWHPCYEIDGFCIAIFSTRKVAREAQKTCCYSSTRVERVKVTIEKLL